MILGNEENKDNAKSFKQEVLTLKIVLTEHSDSEKEEDKNRIKSRLLIINLVRNNGRTKVKTKRAQRLKSTTNWMFGNFENENFKQSKTRICFPKRMINRRKDIPARRFFFLY